MSALTTFLATLRTYIENISTLANKKPTEALTADDTTLLGGITKASLLGVVQTKASAHITNLANPHATTAAKLSGVDKAYVDAGLAAGVPLSVLPISQYGDTTDANLGITTVGFVLSFSKTIQAYLLGTFKLFPVMSINLADTDPSPANKTFYVYVTLANGDLTYVVSLTKLAESLGMMCVGRVVTNSSSVTLMSIGRVSRLGTFRVATSPQGSSIPTTSGSPIAPAQLNPGWLPAMDEYVFTVTVAEFLAPGKWVGFFAEQGGSVTPNVINGVTIRDFDAAELDLKGPMFFQFAIYQSTPLPRPVRYATVGIHEKLSFSNTVSAASMTRYFFGNGQVNVYEYLKSLLGQTVTIKLYMDKV